MKKPGAVAKARLQAALDEWQEQNGKDPWAALVAATQSKDKRQLALPAWRIVVDTLQKGESQQSIDVTNHSSPTIFLPEEVKPGTPALLTDHSEEKRKH